ncbi:MAG TPA: glycogen synthase [Candidatus Competibacteraceae bacterium]|nr:glycogen synthase [Candidatus Competibacteraceae bacterium]MCP5133072.1 glycogen synthase [Gammaproteobacteria bacterium]HPF57374.1 glycogen synthase [Candidatus Competibacteraceae bacterium]HRY17296.1 glycogen synthase [Candidatus Competibacteraceae bacterium]
MRILLTTNEYPPHVYGGAGVHVEYLSRELAKLTTVEVRSFHDQTLDEGQLHVRGIKMDTTHFAGCPQSFVSPLKALSTCLAFVGQGIGADLEDDGNAEIIHCHTWYAHFSGILAKILYNIPMVITVHSLEPLRPWKRDQLGHGYDLSCWIEKSALETADAIIAVSRSTREDILRLFDVDPTRVVMIPNGIDTEEYQPVHAPEVLNKHGIDPDRPYVLFVGRITRQKGLYYLLQAIPHLDPKLQVVLCAGDADTLAMQREIEEIVEELQSHRAGIVWIPEMLPRQETIALYSHATIFCCPSIYEPFGIINLEAMACGTPVVGSAVGGICEVVVDGETGLLVDPHLSVEPPHDPISPARFERGMAEAINRIANDPELCMQMGRAGRERVERHYSWRSIAQQTYDLYRRLRAQRNGSSN